MRWIKIGAQVADLGGAACVAAIAEDVPEYDVATAATSAMTREIAKRPHIELRDTDVVSVWPEYRRCSPSGDDPSPQARDILSLNCFPMIAGYYTALERTLFLGQPSDEQLRHWGDQL